MTLKKLILFLLSLTMVLFLAACSDNSTEPEEEINEFDLVTAVGDVYYTEYKTASGKGVNTTIGDVFTLLTDGDTSNDPYILDYRGSGDFANGHITGAINIALGDLMSHLGNIPDGKMVLNVCYTGQNASVATAVLNMLGYEAQNLKFGMCAVTDNVNEISGTDKWKSQITGADEYTLNKVDVGPAPDRSGFPILSTSKETAEEVIIARFSNAASGWNVKFNDFLTDKDNYFIVNYWGSTDYMDPGHIEDAYQFTPNLAFQKAEDLEKLPTDKKIVIYCWTGQTSAQVTAYLRILGYDAYSLLYGVNGFGYNQLSSHKYTIPTEDYSSIITQ